MHQTINTSRQYGKWLSKINNVTETHKVDPNSAKGGQNFILQTGVLLYNMTLVLHNAR